MDIFDQATELHKAKKLDEAEKLYDLLLTQNYDNAGLLATLGTLYLQKNKIGLAITLLETSLKYGKDRPSDVLSNLGLAYRNAGQHDRCLEYLEESVHKHPSAQCLANYGGMFIESDEVQKCIDNSVKAIEMDPELAIAHWNLGLCQLADGKWETGWDEYEWGLKCMRVDRKIRDIPYWDGTPGKTVLVYGEQGIGDEIMFASILPDLMKTNTVILESHKRLKTLFEKSFPGLICYGTREDELIDWPDNHQIDYRMSIGSLGRFYRRSRDAFPGTPYLHAEEAPRGKKFRVGISWTGGMKQGRILKRSVPLTWWKSILNNDCEFVSLQYTDAKEELDLMDRLGYDIKRPEAVFADDYYETAKLVKSCDLVISVCTSVIHLAGALGVPCWVLTPKNPAWRYLNQGGMPWYRSVRLYRQTETTKGSWRPVVERAGYDLSELLKSKERKVA